MDNKTGSNHGLKVVSKNTIHKKHWEKYQNMVSFLGTIWPSTDPKMVPKLIIFPTHCFHVSPGICRRFWPEVLTQTPKNAVFSTEVLIQRSLIMRWKRVLTRETPGNFFRCHHNRFRDTISLECIVEDDGVRSCFD